MTRLIPGRRSASHSSAVRLEMEALEDHSLPSAGGLDPSFAAPTCCAISRSNGGEVRCGVHVRDDNRYCANLQRKRPRPAGPGARAAVGGSGSAPAEFFVDGGAGRSEDVVVITRSSDTGST